MYTKEGVYVCRFKNLREAANCMVACGFTDKYTNAKTRISTSIHEPEKYSVAYGFKWEYKQTT